MKPKKKKKFACRYGKNGFFGICLCDACQNEVIVTDVMILEWLRRHVVEVRKPLTYGSRSVFVATPMDQDGEEDLPSDLIIQCADRIREEVRAKRRATH